MKKKKLNVYIHFVMALCGGFYGGYAITARMAVFGSAQTANLIELVCDILGRDFWDVLLRVGALVIYMAAIILSTVIGKRTEWNLRYLTLGAEIFTVAALGFFPAQMNPMLALYPIFFIAPFQWCAFGGAAGYASSTIFSTNNMKQMTIAFTEYFLIKEVPENEGTDEVRRERLHKGLLFGGTLLSFHTGVGAAYLSFQAAGVRGIWFCLIPLCVSVCLNAAEERAAQEEACMEAGMSMESGMGTGSMGMGGTGTGSMGMEENAVDMHREL